jgi:multimeric flavodoxin WrbA
MHLLVINGSPRGENGITEFLLRHFCEGARKKGATFEIIRLAGLTIHNCTGEFHCWVKKPGVCLWDGKTGDPMQEIRQKIVYCENLILGTPVFVDGMTGLMKNMLDRCIPIFQPFVELDENQQVRHPFRQGPKKKMVLVSTCAFPEMATFGPLVSHAERIARNLHARLVGRILRPNGAVLPFRKILGDTYTQIVTALERAGSEFVENGRVSPGTEAEISKDLMTTEVYVLATNSFWNKAIEKGELLTKAGTNV